MTGIVLFDIGNVLAPDYWESLWLTKNIGLSDQLGIPIQISKSIGKSLWNSYNRVERSEDEYWAEFSLKVGKNIPKNLIAEVENAVIRPNPFAQAAFEKASSLGLRIGIISNNTSFWYRKQLSAVSFFEYGDEELCFISCNLGAIKRDDSPDLFALAADFVDVGSTLIFDDRPKNVAFAKKIGFETALYGYQDSVDTGSDKYYQPSDYTPFSFDKIRT